MMLFLKVLACERVKALRSCPPPYKGPTEFSKTYYIQASYQLLAGRGGGREIDIYLQGL